MLRWLGCKLPVEFWHLGRGEMDSQMIELAKRLDVTVIDAREFAKSLPNHPRILNGWELKPFSVLHSRFEEVMYLDADCIPIQNPEKLFESAEYQDTGAIFWPDLAPHDRKEWIPDVVWERCGMVPRNYVDFESGQVVVNKRKCWDAMLLTQWMNEHSDYWYKMVFGDKTTWHLCWQKLERRYSMPNGACGWQWPAIIQHDFQGQPIFVHCVRGKEDLCAANLMQVPMAAKMQDAGRVLNTLWRRRIWDHQDETPEEQQLRTTTAGRFRYVRVGLGERTLELLPDGSIGEGKAGCEKRWTLRILNGVPTIVVLGESHKGSEVGMMFLTKSDDGIWRGAWEFFERCPVEMHPIIDTTPPSHWNFRPGTWDRDIYDCVVRDNEYRLPASFGPNDVIVDIGAHIGSFSHACLIRGAGKVVSVEPNPGNFALLMGNLAAKYSSRIRPIHAALCHWEDQVFVSDGPGPNTGGGGMCDQDYPGANLVPALHLDLILRLANGPIRLLKLDCEGAEWNAFLFGESRLDNVQEIVAELHGGNEWEAKTEQLNRHLGSIGFDVAIELKHAEHGLGYLFAKRGK
jgi:FkbM family methyltransferase